MIGSQAIALSTGVTISPGSGEFEAVLDAGEEDFLTRIGAIRRAAGAPPPVTAALAPAAKRASEQ